jgi:two-component system, response regulator
MEEKPMFLFAEDDPDDQFLIQSVAEEVCPPAVKLQFVGNGIELMNFLYQEANNGSRPSVIVLDLNMPRKDGREALKEIKTDPHLADIPTVILTTSNIEEDVQYCQKYGIAGYFHKPGSVSELREIINKLCERYLGSS